jgi:chorismate mutase/prephenate dehydratase
MGRGESRHRTGKRLMRTPTETIEGLRGEIDQIDDALHDLIMHRAEISRAIAGVKQARKPGIGGLASAFRPAREAAVLRRLLARHEGALPPRVLARIWREIIAASLSVQTRFELHVYAADNHSQFVDLAHAHFGSFTPVKIHTRPSLVVHGCAEEPDSIGVVPLPEIEEAGAAWWAQLAPAGEKGPRIVAKLPFVASEGEIAAYAIAAIEQEPSGDDTTLLLLEIAPSVSRTKLKSLLKGAGLDARLVAAGRLMDKKVPDELLLEVTGFVGGSDPRLAALMQTAGDIVGRVAPIGGFANPIVTAGAI